MKKTKGFTLIEVILAIIVIAVIATAAFEFFHYLQRFTVDTERKFIAVNFGRQTIEELYWSPEPADVTPTPLPDGTLPNGAMTHSINPDSTGNYEIITVTVSWD